MLNEDVLREFIFDCTIRKLSKRTIDGYRNANLRLFNFLKGEFGITELEETHHQAIRAYVQYQTDQNLSPVYINRNIISYKMYFRYCVQEGYIKHNPIDKVKSFPE